MTKLDVTEKIAREHSVEMSVRERQRLVQVEDRRFVVDLSGHTNADRIEIDAEQLLHCRVSTQGLGVRSRAAAEVQCTPPCDVSGKKARAPVFDAVPVFGDSQEIDCAGRAGELAAIKCCGIEAECFVGDVIEIPPSCPVAAAAMRAASQRSWKAPEIPVDLTILRTERDCGRLCREPAA